jgi:hypothetical protein
MDQAHLTAEHAYESQITKARIIGEGDETEVYAGPGRFLKKPRIKIRAEANIGDKITKLELWLFLRDQDCSILGARWGSDTSKWVNQDLKISAIKTGSTYRLKIGPWIASTWTDEAQ